MDHPQKFFKSKLSTKGVYSSKFGTKEKESCNFQDFSREHDKLLPSYLPNEDCYKCNSIQEQSLIHYSNFLFEEKKTYFLMVINNIRAYKKKLMKEYFEVYGNIENMTEDILQSIRYREKELKEELETIAVQKLSEWNKYIRHYNKILSKLEKNEDSVLNDDLYKDVKYLDIGDIKFSKDCVHIIKSIQKAGTITFLKGSNGNDLIVDDLKKRIPKFVFGGSGKEPGQFCRPWGVCSDPTGRILICDRSNHRIQVFNECGEFVFEFGKEGSNPGEFNRPSGVVVDSSFRIVIADKDNHRIQIFTYNGRFLFEFGSEGTLPGQFKYPWDVSVNKKCEIAVSDTKNHRIQLFSSNGDFITFLDAKKLGFGNLKLGLRYLDSPRGLAFRSDGNLLATDFNNHRVLLIDRSFTKVKKFGCKGSEKGKFFRPQGVACDEYGNFAVSDSKNYRVQVFEANGKFLRSFGIQGGDPGEFDCPQGICYHPNKSIVVVDFSNNRVQVF